MAGPHGGSVRLPIMSAPAPDTSAESVTRKTLQFSLRIQGARIDVSAELPEGPVLPSAVLPIIQSLSSSISTLTENESARLGRPVSCRAGCGACCRQAVPISPVEARMLSEYIDAQPPERREVLRARFRAAAERIEESGVAAELRDAAEDAAKDIFLDKERTHSLGAPLLRARHSVPIPGRGKLQHSCDPPLAVPRIPGGLGRRKLRAAGNRRGHYRETVGPALKHAQEVECQRRTSAGRTDRVDDA